MTIAKWKKKWTAILVSAFILLLTLIIIIIDFVNEDLENIWNYAGTVVIRLLLGLGIGFITISSILFGTQRVTNKSEHEKYSVNQYQILQLIWIISIISLIIIVIPYILISTISPLPLEYKSQIAILLHIFGGFVMPSSAFYIWKGTDNSAINMIITDLKNVVNDSRDIFHPKLKDNQFRDRLEYIAIEKYADKPEELQIFEKKANFIIGNISVWWSMETEKYDESLFEEIKSKILEEQLLPSEEGFEKTLDLLVKNEWFKEEPKKVNEYESNREHYLDNLKGWWKLTKSNENKRIFDLLSAKLKERDLRRDAVDFDIQVEDIASETLPTPIHKMLFEEDEAFHIKRLKDWLQKYEQDKRRYMIRDKKERFTNELGDRIVSIVDQIYEREITPVDLHLPSPWLICYKRIAEEFKMRDEPDEVLRVPAMMIEALLNRFSRNREILAGLRRELDLAVDDNLDFAKIIPHPELLIQEINRGIVGLNGLLKPLKDQADNWLEELNVLKEQKSLTAPDRTKVEGWIEELTKEKVRLGKLNSGLEENINKLTRGIIELEPREEQLGEKVTEMEKVKEGMNEFTKEIVNLQTLMGQALYEGINEITGKTFTLERLDEDVINGIKTHTEGNIDELDNELGRQIEINSQTIKRIDPLVSGYFDKVGRYSTEKMDPIHSQLLLDKINDKEKKWLKFGGLVNSFVISISREYYERGIANKDDIHLRSCELMLELYDNLREMPHYAALLWRVMR